MVELEELQSTSLKSDRSERIRTQCKTLGDYSWLPLNFILPFSLRSLINKFSFREILGNLFNKREIDLISNLFEQIIPCNQGKYLISNLFFDIICPI